jgi:MYXO-CTERM domain-containing protein
MRMAGKTFAPTLLAVGTFCGALLCTPASAQGLCTGSDTTPNSACFRLLCNTALADGSIRNDECSESCDLGTPTRWATPFIDVTIENLSSGIDNLSTGDWNTIVSSCLNQWNGVSSSNLTLSNAGSNVSRTFGGNLDSHEVFWITSQNEWQQKVGSGVFGALGVTTARYDIFFGPCGDRDIYDADLVMNGVSAANFNWSATANDCPGFEYCSNAQGTLLHELGHFVGMGHPCADDSCESWSIMAATSAPSFNGQFNPAETLRTADFAAAEALYPGTPGGLGSPCSGNSCNGGLSCETINNDTYCTESCTGDNDCGGAFVCDVGGTNLCVFPGSIEPGVGESCTDLGFPCDNNTGWCLGAQGEEGTCYQACNPQQGNGGCPADEDCLAFEGTPSEGFCFPGLAGVNEFCDNTQVFCNAPLQCISGACRNPCDYATGNGCGAGEVCFYFNDTCDPGNVGSPCFDGDTCPQSAFCPDYSYCLPAGAGLEGAVCEDAFDCATGKICLIDGPGNESHCYQRCDQSFTCSSPEQTCVDLPDPANPDQTFLSYCNPLADELIMGDGDGDGDGDPGDGDGDGDPGDGDGDGDPGDGDGDPGDGDGDGDVVAPDGQCNPGRGHWDCPDGEACDDDLVDGPFGECAENDDLIGEAGSGGLCGVDSDCYGGLCVRGVCTYPCDFAACPAGFGCINGICTPEDCGGDDSVCDEDYSCQTTATGDEVCAKGGGSPLDMFCACVTSSSGDADAGPPMLAGMLVGLIGLSMRRRRR